MDADRCPNCGGAEMKPLGEDRYRCSYCDAILKRPANKRAAPSLVIAPGAKINIRKSGHVIVKGIMREIRVGEGATIDVEGTFEIEEPGDPAKRGHHR